MGTKIAGILLVLLFYQGVQVESAYKDDVLNLRSVYFLTFDKDVQPAQTTEVKVRLNLLSIKDLVTPACYFNIVLAKMLANVNGTASDFDDHHSAMIEIANKQDSDEEILKASGWFTVIWNTGLAWDKATYNNIGILHFNGGEIWSPKLVIENGVSTIGVLAEQNLLYRYIANGDMIWELPTYFEVTCDMDLKFFPFDKQTCGITMSSWSFDASEINLKMLDNTVNLALYKSNSEWDLTETRVEETQTEAVVGNETRTYSKVTFYLTLSRKTHYYGINLILPLVVLSLLSTLVFILPAEGGEKASFSIFLMLAFFVLNSIILTSFPMSAETTVIAVYITLIFCILSSSTLCASLVLCVHHSDPGQPMSAASRRLSSVLLILTCKSSDSDKDMNEDLESSETASTNLGNSMNKSNGSLRNTSQFHIGAYPPRQLPPVDTIYKRNQVRPKSESSVKTMKTEALSVRELNSLNLKELAANLDRCFFVMFLVITVLVNFILLLMLSLGNS